MKCAALSKCMALTMAVFFGFSAVVHAQKSEIGRSAIKTADGFLFIQNGAEKSFTLKLRGKEVRANTAGDNPAFFIDGKLVQLVIVENRLFLRSVKDLNDEKVLEIHRDWETDYAQNEVYKTKLKVESEAITAGERKFLFWGFTRPAQNQMFNRDYFLTTVIGDGLLGLSSPIKPGESIADYKKLFLDIMSTLVVSDKPLDVLKLADQVHQGQVKSN